MKKFLIVSSAAILAFATVASAATIFTSNLTVGSKGAEVVALQDSLIAGGYNIAAIQSGAAAKGYFGSQTKAAVQAYQTANGVPSTGFVGPLTRGKLNGGGASLPPVSSMVPPAGSTVGNNVTGGTDGSISVSQSSYVSTGATLKKGDTKNVVAVKLQATAGPVTVKRFDVHFSSRPWLLLSNVTLKDSSGAVLASKPISSIADVTEITVGSDYLVRFEGLNYVVTPGVNPDLAVAVTVLSATDKITNNMSITINVTGDSIRTVNQLGFTESKGGVTVGATTGVGASTFLLSSSGSVADITTRISPSSPATQATVPVSATVTTNNVMLGLFSLKSANNSATVNNLKFQVNTNPAFAETGLFSNFRLMIGSTSYGALSFSDAGLVTFTNLNIALAQDAWTDVKLVADVAATSTNVLASSTLKADTIDAIDSTYTQATVGGVTWTGASASNQVSVNTLMTVNSVSISNLSAANVQGVQAVANGPVVAESVTYTFTLTNNSSNSLYVSSNVSTFISATSTVPAGNASSTITAIEPMAAVAGDAAGYYILPSGGGSRTFTVSGMIQKSSGTIKSERLSVTGIQYGATSAGTGSTITSGLETLTTSIVI